MTYDIEFSRFAAREFKKLPEPVQERLELRLQKLCKQPRPPDVKKMAGAKNLYRVREGDYRLVYEIRDRALLIVVVRVGHRQNIYRRL